MDFSNIEFKSCSIDEAISLLETGDYKLAVHTQTSREGERDLLDSNGVGDFIRYGGNLHYENDGIFHMQDFYKKDLNDQKALLKTAKKHKFLRLWKFVVMPDICYQFYKCHECKGDDECDKIDLSALSVELLLGSLKGADRSTLDAKLLQLYKQIKVVEIEYYVNSDEEIDAFDEDDSNDSDDSDDSDNSNDSDDSDNSVHDEKN